MKAKKYFLALMALIVGCGGDAAFAEVQNIKVGGDLSIIHHRNRDMDLYGESHGLDATYSSQFASDSLFMTKLRLYVSADLTDNVQAYVRMCSEYEWDYASNGESIWYDSTEGAAYGVANGLTVSDAYLKLTEFLYSPLTLTIGRQEIMFGTGLVLGNGNPYRKTSLISQDYYTWRKSFDAFRADLDFDPWKFTAIAAVINQDTQNSITSNSTFGQNGSTNNNQEGEWVLGASASYMWPSEWLTEAYYVGSFAKDTVTAGGNSIERHTIALRGEGRATPIDDKLFFEGEVTYQWGEYSASQDIDAWSVLLGGSYEFDNMYKPVLSMTYEFRSGDDKGTSGDFEGWESRYNERGIGTMIEQIWLAGRYASTAATTRGKGGNIHALTTTGSFSPFEDIEVSLSWIYAKADEDATSSTGDDIGDEVIGAVTYDYTEDVTFHVQGAYFNPGNAFTASEDENAYEIISSVTVEF